jgi:hypothetical protein
MQRALRLTVPAVRAHARRYGGVGWTPEGGSRGAPGIGWTPEGGRREASGAGWIPETGRREQSTLADGVTRDLSTGGVGVIPEGMRRGDKWTAEAADAMSKLDNPEWLQKLRSGARMLSGACPPATHASHRFTAVHRA